MRRLLGIGLRQHAGRPEIDEHGAVSTAAGHSAVPDGPVLRRLDRRHAEHPADQPVDPGTVRGQRARRLLDQRGRSRALRRADRCGVAQHSGRGGRGAHHNRQPNQGARTPQPGRCCPTSYAGHRLHRGSRGRGSFDSRDQARASACRKFLSRRRNRVRYRRGLSGVAHQGHHARRQPCDCGH